MKYSQGLPISQTRDSRTADKHRKIKAIESDFSTFKTTDKSVIQLKINQFKKKSN